VHRPLWKILLSSPSSFRKPEGQGENAYYYFMVTFLVSFRRFVIATGESRRGKKEKTKLVTLASNCRREGGEWTITNSLYLSGSSTFTKHNHSF